ncbi:MAG: helix-turn-helix domain-containing protein [Firmicutes bacterium]|nr:helix-turn-helix domain-containing protein [Bacillota bacterium]
MKTSDKIKQLRIAKGLSQEALGEMVGVKKAAINKYETGRVINIKRSTLQKLATALGVSAADLLDDENNVEAYNVPIGTQIPVYGCIPAGLPLEAIDCIDGYVDVPSEWLAKGDEYFGLRVKGDSMSPKYLDGDLIILRRQPDCESGQDAAVRVNGDEATLKKVVKLMDGIMLQPLNPEYTPRQYDYTDEFNPVEIMGVVVQLRRDV